MAKKITALLLAAAMLFCFSGCEFFDKLYDMHINNGKNNSSSSSESERFSARKFPPNRKKSRRLPPHWWST